MINIDLLQLNIACLFLSIPNEKSVKAMARQRNLNLIL